MHALHGVPIVTELLCLVIHSEKIPHKINPKKVSLICVVKIGHLILIVHILLVVMAVVLAIVAIVPSIVAVIHGN